MRNLSAERGLLCTLALTLASLLALSGCAATKIKEVWKDDAYQGHPTNVLVVAVAGNATVRRTIESGLAKRLKDRGAAATEGFRVLPDGASPESDAGRSAVTAVIKERGIDAVLLAQVAGRRSGVQYIPGMTIQTGFGYPYGGGMGYSAVIASSAPMAPTTQGYTHETKFLDIETRLFDAVTERSVWAVRTETRIEGVPQEEIVPYIDLVVRELFQSKIF